MEVMLKTTNEKKIQIISIGIMASASSRLFPDMEIVVSL